MSAEETLVRVGDTHPMEAHATGAPTPGLSGIIRKLIDRPESHPEVRHMLRSDVYTSAERFERERTRLFRKLPVPLMPSAALKDRGTVAAHFEYGVPLLATRDQEGRARVMYNVCRHRGSCLVDQREAQKKNLVSCPYHAWAYKLDGGLTGVPQAPIFPGLDKAANGLVQVRTHEAGGMIWVTLDDRVPDGFETLDELCQDLDALGFGQMHLYQRRVHDVKANWKLIIDGFQENYHVPILHSQTVGKMFKKNRSVDEPVGLHRRFATARKDFDPGIANSRDLGLIQKDITFSYIGFPGTTIVVSPTYVNVLVCYPQAVNHTLMEDFMLIPALPDTPEKESHYARSWALLDHGVYEKEDLMAAERCQKGLEAGVVAELNIGGLEVPIHEYHQQLERLIA